MKTLDEINAEIAELEAAQTAATKWGAAVGARFERLKGLYPIRDQLQAEQAKIAKEQSEKDAAIARARGEEGR